MSGNQAHETLASFMRIFIPVATLILLVFTLAAGFLALHIDASPSIYTVLGGASLVVAGVSAKFLFDLLMARRQEKELQLRLLKSLLMEYKRNFELAKSKKIQWPQVHFEVASYRNVNEKALLNHLADALRSKIAESHRLISEIEKRKFKAFDKETEVMLERLVGLFPQIIGELEERASR